VQKEGKTAYRVGNEQFDLPAEIRQPEFPVDLGVRPEHVLIGESGVPAEVHIVQPIGPFTYVTVLWDGGKATSRVNGISHLKPKEPVHIQFSPAGLHFFDRATENRVELNI